MRTRVLGSFALIAYFGWVAACSSGLGDDPRNRGGTAASTAAQQNLPTGLDLGVTPTAEAGEPVAAGLVVPAIASKSARDVVLVAFTTATASNASDAGGPTLSRDATADTNGAADVFVAAVVAQDIERRAFSQSLAGKFRHPRCKTCHSMQASDTIAFASSASAFAEPHAGPPPGPTFPNNQPGVCAPCHVTSNTFPVAGWMAPAASFDIRPKTVAQLAQMARNVPADETEHFVTDPRVLWALDTGILPQVGGRNGIADDDHDGVVEPEDRDGTPRTVPGGSANFLDDVENWRATATPGVADSEVDTTAAAVADVTLVSRAFGSANAGNGASTAPRVRFVPNGSFDPGNPTATAIGTLFVAFQSTATDLVAGDTNAAADVFRAAVELRSAADGTLDLVALPSATLLCSARNGLSTPGNGASTRPSIGGANAEIVAFESLATNLVATFSDTNGAGAADVYLRNLGIGGAGTTTHLVSHTVGNAATGGDGASEAPAVAPAGDAIAFESAATNLINLDANAERDVYFATGTSSPFTKVRASVTAAGAEATGGASRAAAVHTDSGRVRIAFESDATNLAATTAATNVFLFDSQTGGTTLLNQRISGGVTSIGDGSARAPAITANGAIVAFESDASNIEVLATTRPDTNGTTDIFLVETAQVAQGLVLPFRITLTTREAAASDGPSTRPSIGSFTGSADFQTGFATYLTDAKNLGTSDTTKIMVAFLDETSGVIANFSATPLEGLVPLQVQFTDASSGFPTSWAWDFDNDGNVDSTEQNPRRTFATPGNFTVRLAASNADSTGTKTEVNLIAARGAVTADFTTSATSGAQPLTILFTDTSTQPNGTISAWEWDFENDGTVDSTAQNPSHEYPNQGTFSVRLTATGQGSSATVTRTNLIRVDPPGPVTAAFTSAVSSSPVAGRVGTTVGSVWNDETVQFTDTSTGTVTSRVWDFGDGTTATTNPATHVYATPGTYSVTLTVTGPGGTDAEVKPNLITSIDSQTTVELQASKDNSIYNDPQNASSIDFSNSANTRLVAGRAGNVPPMPNPPVDHGIRRALIEFDVSSIPATSIVNSATLEMTCSSVFTNPTGDETISIHRLTREWGEVSSAIPGGIGGGTAAEDGEVTWDEAIRGSSNWTTNGGDFVGAASASTLVTDVVPTTFSWSSATMRTDVAGWVANSSNNHGWIVRSAEGGAVGNRTTKVFDSRENATAANRPKLTVAFRPPLP